MIEGFVLGLGVGIPVGGTIVMSVVIWSIIYNKKGKKNDKQVLD